MKTLGVLTRCVMASIVVVAAACGTADGGADGADVRVAPGPRTATDVAPASGAGADGATDGPPDGAAAPPFADFYALHQANALEFEIEAGHWLEDFGDAAFYGPAFFAWAGVEYGRADYLALAEAGAAYSDDLVRRSAEDLSFFLAHMDEALMGAFGVMEYVAATGDAAVGARLDDFIDRTNETAAAFGTYLDLDIESYSLRFYGPTTITAVVALLNLRAAQLLGGPRKAERIAQGVAVLDVIEEHAWSGTAYRFRPGDDALYLYPDVVMIITNAVAAQLTGEERFRERALAVHRGIRPLYDPEKRAWRSPYSAEYMGAQTDDYITLSSQNFLMMGLALLYQLTGDPAYREELGGIAAFVEGWLYDPAQGRILHHWMDGRIAQPQDPEYWCSGCNLQFLYVLWFAEAGVWGDGAPDPPDGPDPPPDQPPDPEALAAAVEADRIGADLAFVAAERPPGSPHWQAVQDRCAERFAAAGFEVERFAYATGVDVVGVLQGTARADEQVVVSAHYDHIEGCAGADDNGSGVAGVLETARVLGAARHARTLVVACWDEEENGLHGSSAWVARMRDRGEQVVAAFVYETMGYRAATPGSQQLPAGFDVLFRDEAAWLAERENRGDFLAVIADDSARGASDAILRHAERVGLPAVRLELDQSQKTAPLFFTLQRSDHAPFWHLDVPALMLTDTAEFRNTHYHCRGGPDTADRLDPAFIADGVRVTVGAAAELLDGP